MEHASEGPTTTSPQGFPPSDSRQEPVAGEFAARYTNWFVFWPLAHPSECPVIP